MKVRSFKDSSLWARTLAEQPGCPHNPFRRDLAAAYDKFRDRAGDLTNEIHALLPNLTVHNVDHLDALWDVASTICGDDYPINPLEAIVLGGAILVHDAGMALAAFPGRLQEIKQHARWREHEKAAWRRRGVEEAPTAAQEAEMGDEARREAAFDIVRAEHARKAETLLFTLWHKPGDPQPLALLPDDTLRQSYGELIGKIAASHHWGVGELTRKLQTKLIPATQPYPKAWTIDAIKLACLLRCADAANIDETRAPSFVYAMRRPDKISRQHWEFQNRLLSAQAEGDALVFQSKTAFEEKDSAAWWLCRETIAMCSEQLAQADALLRDEGRDRFAIRGVKGADDPRRLKETVQVSGWEPVDTTVKVTDVLGLVGSLGGKHLYGDDPLVPLRELIQNAADAIRARRKVDPDFYASEAEHRRGRITIHIKDDADPDRFWLIVEDDGVGMRERVMTGPLLDFGTSFWRSPMAGEEFPGLVADEGFTPTGRFGIGFYSVFMYADRVRVTSRRANQDAGGHEKPRTLEFKEGLTRRAIIRDYRRSDDGALATGVSTSVAVRLPRDLLEKWYVQVGDTSQTIPSIGRRLQWLVIGLDVAVGLFEAGQRATEVHSGSYHDLSNVDLLHRISRSRPGEFQVLDAKIDRAADRIRPIMNSQGRLIGRGAVAPNFEGAYGLSVRLIGGLSAREDHNCPLQYNFIGVAEASPSNASRNVGKFVLSDAFKSWGDEQSALILQQGDLTAKERSYCADALILIGVEIGQLAQLRCGGHLMTLDEFVKFVQKRTRAIVPMSNNGVTDNQGKYFSAGLTYKLSVRRTSNDGQELDIDVNGDDLDLADGVLLGFGLTSSLGGIFIDQNSRILRLRNQSIAGALLAKLEDAGLKLEFIEHEIYNLGMFKGEPLMHPALEIRFT